MFKNVIYRSWQDIIFIWFFSGYFVHVVSDLFIINIISLCFYLWCKLCIVVCLLILFCFLYYLGAFIILFY